MMDKEAFATATSLDQQLRSLQSQLEHLKDCTDPRQIPWHIVVPPEEWLRFRGELVNTVQRRVDETKLRFAAL